MTGPLLSTSEAAVILGVSARHVDRLADAGLLRCERTAAGRVFRRRDVIRLAADRAERAAARVAGGPTAAA